MHCDQVRLSAREDQCQGGGTPDMWEYLTTSFKCREEIKTYPGKSTSGPLERPLSDVSLKHKGVILAGERGRSISQLGLQHRQESQHMAAHVDFIWDNVGITVINQRSFFVILRILDINSNSLTHRQCLLDAGKLLYS